MQTIDLIGDPEIIARIAELARNEGHVASEPMASESITDALDSPFGAEEVKHVCDVVTVIMHTGTSVAGFLAAVRALLHRSESSHGQESSVEVRETAGQKPIGTIRSGSDLPPLST